MPHSLTKKCPAKKYFCKKIKYFVSLASPCCRTSSGWAWTWGKKRWLLKKMKKRGKKSCFVPLMQFVHTVGGSRTSKTSNSSSSSNSNNSSYIYWLDRFGCATRYIQYSTYILYISVLKNHKKCLNYFTPVRRTLISGVRYWRRRGLENIDISKENDTQVFCFAYYFLLFLSTSTR